MRFYLGTHVPSWLEFLDIPLFVSRRRLGKNLPRALGRWALDSGGFSELSLFGEWRTTVPQYVAEVRRFESEIGGLDWAAPMDWMCEPHMLKKTGLTVEEHQRRTVRNYLELREHLDIVIPVLQGWVLDDYLRCIEMYVQAGVDDLALTTGIGSVCRRQHTDEAAAIFERLFAEGLTAMHGFGVKTQGLQRIAHHLESADSMAWSLDGRRQPPLPGCSHMNCANCDRYALRWRGRLLQQLRGVELERPSQMEPIPVDADSVRLLGSRHRRRMRGR